jgi:PAS domain S-box-containing protein
MMRSRSINILVIEDNRGDFELIKQTLKSSTITYSLTWKQSLQDGVNYIKNNLVDSILLDLNLPDSNGLETLNKIIDISGESSVVVLTGNANEQMGLEAMKIGAHDYLIKGELEPALLPRAIRYAIERKESELILKNHQLILEEEVEKRTRELIKANHKLKEEIQSRIIAEKNLAKSEENFRLISLSANEAIIKMNDKGQVEFWNPAAEKIFGYHAKEMIGKDAHEFLTPKEKWSDAQNGMAVFLKTGQGKLIGQTHEMEAMHKSGKTIPVEISLSSLKISNDEHHAVGIIRDISERKKAENHIKENNIFLETLINNIPAPIFYKNTAGKYIGANKAFYQFLNLKPEQVLEKSVYETLGSDYKFADAYLNKDKELFSEGGKQIYESKVINGNGDERDVIFHKAVYKNSMGQIAGLVGMFIDITESKEVTAELTRLKNNLEMEVHKQTKQLREANATKDKFFSIIAHDLKSPFNVIQGFLSLIYNEFDEFTAAELKEFIGKTLEASTNTFTLLENLLEWSRSQRGTIAFNPVNIDIYELCSELLYLHQDIAKQKGISLNLNINHDHMAYADPEMIRTVLRNLLTNAIKFTHPGGMITINSKLSDEEIVIYVKDEGIGMDETFQANLFKPNAKTQRQGTRKEKGTGLGLILCKEFVERNNGEIWVKSSENEGSTFYFSLPAQHL